MKSGPGPYSADATAKPRSKKRSLPRRTFDGFVHTTQTPLPARLEAGPAMEKCCVSRNLCVVVHVPVRWAVAASVCREGWIDEPDLPPEMRPAESGDIEHHLSFTVLY